MTLLRLLNGVCALLHVSFLLVSLPLQSSAYAADMSPRQDRGACSCGTHPQVVQLLRQYPEGGYAMARDVAQHVRREPEAAPGYFCPPGSNDRQKIAIGAGLRLAVKTQPLLEEKFKAFLACAEPTVLAAYVAADGSLLAQLGLSSISTSFPAVISPSNISGGPISRHTVP